MASLLVLCLFSLSLSSSWALDLPSGLQWGVATAPGHVEDRLSDLWMDWAARGNVSAFQRETAPEKRLLFWTAPEIEMKWMERLGVQWVRTGIDWGRIQPHESGAYDETAILGYLQTIRRLKKHHRVLLTLFHHSLPIWAMKRGGWSDPSVLQAWEKWVQVMAERFGAQVDGVVTLNEPVIFVLLSDGLREWPNPSFIRGGMSILDWNPLPFFQGRVFRSLSHLDSAHRSARDAFRAVSPRLPVGIAHHYSRHRSTGSWLARLIHPSIVEFMNWRFPESIEDAVDFVGVNYYGSELFSRSGLVDDPDREVSEAGRAVDAPGLTELLVEMNARMKKRGRTIPIWITENGVADRTDHLRVPYLYAHLRAIARAVELGVRVETYFHWTLSDNWEWGDGYCPKFGLLAVDRSQLTERQPRPSYDAYREVIRTQRIPDEKFSAALDHYRSLQGALRPTCRGDEPTRGLDQPRQIPWRGSSASFW